MRLQRFLAEAGVASRRAAERLILAGRVTVNGRCVTRLGTRVEPDRDRVVVDGRPVTPRRKVYLAWYKPRGCVCTRGAGQGAPGLREVLPPQWHHLFPVGRLDKESEGLLLLTNDGELCLRLTHPRYGVRKTYRVTVRGRVTPEQLERCQAGITDAGQRLRARRARVRQARGPETVLELELDEGKKREIRRMLAALGLRVRRLVRTRIGPVGLRKLAPGQWRALTPKEIESLLASTRL